MSARGHKNRVKHARGAQRKARPATKRESGDKSTHKNPKLGRPEYVPDDKTRKRVGNLSTAGFTQEKIADIIGIAERTLRKYYPKELDYALPAVADMAVNSLSKAIKAGKPWAVIFFLKTRLKTLGWSERMEFTGADGKPLDLRGLTDEQLDTVRKTFELLDEISRQRGDRAASEGSGVASNPAEQRALPEPSRFH